MSATTAAAVVAALLSRSCHHQASDLGLVSDLWYEQTAAPGQTRRLFHGPTATESPRRRLSRAADRILPSEGTIVTDRQVSSPARARFWSSDRPLPGWEGDFGRATSLLAGPESAAIAAKTPGSLTRRSATSRPGWRSSAVGRTISPLPDDADAYSLLAPMGKGIPIKYAPACARGESASASSGCMQIPRYFVPRSRRPN